MKFLVCSFAAQRFDGHLTVSKRRLCWSKALGSRPGFVPISVCGSYTENEVMFFFQSIFSQGRCDLLRAPCHLSPVLPVLPSGASALKSFSFSYRGRQVVWGAAKVYSCGWSVYFLISRGGLMSILNGTLLVCSFPSLSLMHADSIYTSF